MLSMTSDYAADTGCPGPYLQRIAEAGFTHVHWCHHWSTDFLYADSEMEQIARWFSEFGLGLTDLHASAGQEKGWASRREYERLAGVELVKNRIDMAARLGADVIILHLPASPDAPEARGAFWERVWQSLDALRRPAHEAGVRIALENGNFSNIEQVLVRYDDSYVGLCYDSGHGHLAPDGLDRLERLKGRLISIHLHDNDGLTDQHKIPFTGTIDWPRLIRIIAASAYTKWVSLETTTRHAGIADEADFLAQAHQAAGKLAEMIEAIRR
jgi:sugar phosphate isomerase/epimerase